VLEGRFGVQLGDEVLEAGPGDLLFKPRGVAHAFWNAGDEPARLLELISPAGFERWPPAQRRVGSHRRRGGRLGDWPASYRSAATASMLSVLKETADAFTAG
jgi:hypothetical protein